MASEDGILIHAAMENLARASEKAGEAMRRVADSTRKEINRLYGISISSCLEHAENTCKSYPNCYGCNAYCVDNPIVKYEQMIKGEKEMQKKLKIFDMKDIHSGYVVKFRNGTTALVMRVGAKFTKIFAYTVSATQHLKEGVNFFYTSTYKGHIRYNYSPAGNSTKPDPDHDVVAVYGLVEGVDNYIDVGRPLIENRPLLWEEPVVKMTLEEIEKKLGYKVEIVETEKPVGIKGVDCKRCVYHLGNSKCAHIGLLCGNDYDDCDDCKRSLGLKKCPCNSMYAKDGEPCPYFEGEKA